MVWRPPADTSGTHIEKWRAWLWDTRGLSFGSYEELWSWSVTDLAAFWGSIWEYFGVGGAVAASDVLSAGRGVEGTSWFPGERVNYAEALLDRAPDGVAVVGLSATRERIEVTGAQLRDQVRRVAGALRGLGVVRGDRVAAYLPNIPEALVLMLASASIGAVYTSCPPEFGTRAVLDRFQQVTPKILVAVDGYRHKDKAIPRAAQVAEIRRALPSLVATVLVPYLDADGPVPEGVHTWSDLPGPDPATAEPGFAALPFAHPLYILYSSGSTGLPKPIVHGHGGVLLEHLKLHHLHHDLRVGDRFFWYSTTGWVMWNYLVSGLLAGATIVQFDGDPAHPSLARLWELAERERVTVFGSSAPYYLACRTAADDPTAGLDLTRIRQIGSTGAPLPAEAYYWLRDYVSDTSPVISASGGTDVATALAAGTMIHPVVAGEITCRCLGVRMESYDSSGSPQVDADGELVVTAPMPSMPVRFWGDTDGHRYHEAYFERFDGVWAQGDFVRITGRGSCVISGRADATLNRGGVRLGTSDFYTVVEEIERVADSLVVHLEDPAGGPGQLFLFVELAGDQPLDHELEDQIRTRLRSDLSPRHVPDAVIAVPEVPRTLTGKKLEVPVKRILLGRPKSAVASLDALQSRTSLDSFELIARSLATGH
ncbi:acetoacetate--CoA ligase [Pseudonocardia ailaonensis]|uniref:Acetoacetate--CoA ligase n=1 Tax=Pseudonocardia ailaonensis TaxID=367279 RepID=A0ABN2NJJ5_9PSEU